MATATSAKITGIDVHTYLVKDPKRAVNFYKGALGLTPSWETEEGAEFDLADGSTFGLWKMRDGTWHPGSGVMFAVPDIKEAFAQLRSRGVKFLDDEPFDTGVCHMIGVEDSEGNSFMLHQRRKTD